VTYPPDVWVQADAREGLELLAEALPDPGRRPWFTRPGQPVCLVGSGDRLP
jgi:hypothetical protein